MHTQGRRQPSLVIARVFVDPQHKKWMSVAITKKGVKKGLFSVRIPCLVWIWLKFHVWCTDYIMLTFFFVKSLEINYDVARCVNFQLYSSLHCMHCTFLTVFPVPSLTSTWSKLVQTLQVILFCCVFESRHEQQITGFLLEKSCSSKLEVETSLPK